MEQKDTREQLLDATAEVITRDGVGCLTLEAVAREAGVSKGGLLYHFPNKRKLIEDLIVRQLDRFEEEVYAELARETEGPGRWLRAYIRASTRRQTRPGYGAGMVAIIATEPDLLEILRARYDVWRERLDQDGLDPAVVTLAKMAMDGLRFWRIFGLSPSVESMDAAVELLVKQTITAVP